MEVKVVEKNENQLLRRTEVRFEVDHSGTATPKRLDVRKQLADALGVPEEMVVIEKFSTMHGRQVASGLARAYDSKERLTELEPKFLLERGQPKKEEGEEKPAEKPKEDKAEKPPKEEAKPEKKAEKPKEAEKPEEKVKEKPPEKPKEEKRSGKEGKT